MQAEDNEAIVGRLWQEMFNEGNIEVADELFALDHTLHIPSLLMDETGRDAMKAFVAVMKRIAPDMQVSVDDWVAQDGKVVTSWTARGTAASEMRDSNPEDNEVGVSGVTICHLVEGQIRETWWRFDARLDDESQWSIREGSRDFLLQGKPEWWPDYAIGGICHIIWSCRRC